MPIYRYCSDAIIICLSAHRQPWHFQVHSNAPTLCLSTCAPTHRVMLSMCRGEGQGAGPSLAVWNKDLVALDPDWIIICPCGLDMAETIRELPPLTSSGFWPELKAVREGRVVLVDGNQMFNRYDPSRGCLKPYYAIDQGQQQITEALA
eukprot:GHUV01027794.1.p1 GENE.GHUV01027794.1~~GHUV01027794.1.p1  ORF type:complete len:149 (-),score=21.57 GHUV01027794.1:205-651(-)